MPAELLAPALAAAAVALVLQEILRRLAPRLGLVDRGSGHRTHTGAVPNTGGLASVGGMLLVGTIALPGTLPPLLAIGMFVLLAVGTADDREHIPPLLRFVAQIGTALVMIVAARVVLRDFGELLWPERVAALGWAAVPVTVFCAVGVHNALNMIDGVDGLAGGVAFVALGAVLVASVAANAQGESAVVALALGGLVAFLAYNLRVGRHRARVFLGNGGSLALGFLIAWLLIDASQGPQRRFAPVTALWLLAVPLIDTVSVMWRRLSERSSPFRGDHRHVHHLLLRAGVPPATVTAVLVTLAAAAAALGLAAEWAAAPEALRFYAFLALAFGWHAFARSAERRLPALAAPA